MLILMFEADKWFNYSVFLIVTSYDFDPVRFSVFEACVKLIN